MSKQSAYYQELQEILAKPGCPVCHVGHKSAHGQLDALLWDSVNDPESREKIGRTLGFCNDHSRELLTFQGERLGATIVEQAVLKEALRRLRQGGPAAQSGWRQRLMGDAGKQADGSAERPGGQCPVCAHQAEIEARSLRSLLEHLIGDLDKPLAAAGGLCWPHLDQALRSTGDARVRLALVEVHGQVWEALIGQMGEFIRKRDYRFSHETITDVESVAVERAIAVLTGQYPAIT